MKLMSFLVKCIYFVSQPVHRQARVTRVLIFHISVCVALWFGRGLAKGRRGVFRANHPKLPPTFIVFSPGMTHPPLFQYGGCAPNPLFFPSLHTPNTFSFAFLTPSTLRLVSHFRQREKWPPLHTQLCSCYSFFFSQFYLASCSQKMI